MWNLWTESSLPWQPRCAFEGMNGHQRTCRGMYDVVACVNGHRCVFVSDDLGVIHRQAGCDFLNTPENLSMRDRSGVGHVLFHRFHLGCDPSRPGAIYGWLILSSE